MRPKLLFVCTGNTCRSPMAEMLARTILESWAEVSSAGLMALEGQKASPQAIAAMKKRGLDITAHKARRVSAELLERADYIVPMTQYHEQFLKSEFPQIADKVKRLSDWAGLDEDIADPYGDPVETYIECMERLNEMLQQLLVELKNMYLHEMGNDER